MITIVLLKPETPENVGFIARTMANFDTEKLIIIDPLCDALGERALGVSMHAKNILKNAKIMPYSYLKGIKKEFNLVIGTTSVLGTDYNIQRTPLMPEEFAKKIKNEKIALVFGNEGIGLTNKEIRMCDFVVTIPCSKKYPAMNISHAVAIILYELYKTMGENKIGTNITPASPKEKEIIMKKMNNIFNSLEFSMKEKKETQKITWKRLFEKSMMSKREAFAVLGLLRKVEEKLRK